MRSLLDLLDEGYIFQPMNDGGWRVKKKDGAVYTVDTFGNCDCLASRSCTHQKAVDSLNKLLDLEVLREHRKNQDNPSKGRGKGSCDLVIGRRFWFRQKNAGPE